MTVQKQKIAEFCQTGSGGTPSRQRPEFYENGTVAWVKSGELKHRFVTQVEEFITEEAVKHSSAKLILDNALLIAMYGATVGDVSQLTFKATTNQAVCHIIPDDTICDINYLYYFLKFSKPFLLQKRVGGGQPNISQQVIKALLVPLPPLPTQTHIAHLLDKADELRQKRQTAIKKLDDLLQATFIKMFGDPVVNDKGWEIKPFKDIVINFAEQDNYKDDDEIWLLNLDMIEAQTSQVLQKQFITYKDLNTSTRHFDGTTVLYNKLRPYLNKVVMPKDDEHGYCTSELVVLQPKQVFINRYFLTYYLRSNEFVTWASQKVAGAKMPRLTMTDFWDKPVYIPPLELQTQFAHIATHIETQKAKLQAQADELEGLFLSLQQRVFGADSLVGA